MAAMKDQKKKPKRNYSPEAKNDDVIAQLDRLDFRFLKQDKQGLVEKTKQIYTEQCPGLTDEQQQKDLWKTLAVGVKNNIPLLPLIVDSFSRDRIAHYRDHGGSLELQSWVCVISFCHKS